MATERTLVLVKPDGVRHRQIGEVLRRIEAKGYDIVALQQLVPTAELLEKHYEEHVASRSTAAWSSS